MAILSNIEGNTQFQVCLNKIKEKNNSEYDTWIYCEMKIISNVINCTVGKQNELTLNKYELDNLLKHFNLLLSNYKSGKEYTFDFSNYECNFEVNMCTVLIDRVIEVEIWINWGNYTNGKEAGYDIGMRFVVSIEEFQLFLSDISEEMEVIFQTK